MSAAAATRPMSRSSIPISVVYAFAEAGSKTRRAAALMQSGGCISTQVGDAFTDVAHRKLKMTWAEIRQAWQAIRCVCSAPVPPTMALHDAVMAIAERHRYRIYDALIIAAAVDAGCRTLYSENLADGQTIRGVRIVNPFA